MSLSWTPCPGVVMASAWDFPVLRSRTVLFSASSCATASPPRWAARSPTKSRTSWDSATCAPPPVRRRARRWPRRHRARQHKPDGGRTQPQSGSNSSPVAQPAPPSAPQPLPTTGDSPTRAAIKYAAWTSPSPAGVPMSPENGSVPRFIFLFSVLSLSWAFGLYVFPLPDRLWMFNRVMFIPGSSHSSCGSANGRVCADHRAAAAPPRSALHPVCGWLPARGHRRLRADLSLGLGLAHLTPLSPAGWCPTLPCSLFSSCWAKNTAGAAICCRGLRPGAGWSLRPRSSAWSGPVARAVSVLAGEPTGHRCPTQAVRHPDGGGVRDRLSFFLCLCAYWKHHSTHDLSLCLE